MFELIPFDRNMRSIADFDPIRAFDDMERSFFGNEGMVSTFRTDVKDTGDAFILEAELPGFSKDDLSLDIENDCLTISARRTRESSEEKPNYIKRERCYGSFSRSFDVSGIDIDRIEAAYNDGILTLNMPKKAELVPATRRLEIK